MVRAKASPLGSRIIHYVDWGNDSIKAMYRGGDPVIIRALYFDAPAHYDDTDLQPGTLESPVVSLPGQRVHWGEAARLYSQYSSVVREDKALLLQTGLFAALSPVRYKAEYTTEVILSVPHVKRFRATFPNFEKGLKGTHEYTHNGAPMKVTIEGVTLLPESYGSFLEAKRLGVASKDRLTLVIDIGCGTCLYGLYQPSGDPVDIVCRERAGVVRLVDMLRLDPVVVKAIGDTPNPETMLDALRDGSFKYGAVAQDIRPMAMALGSTWWKSLVSDALSTFHPYRPQIGAVVLTGGGANLARTFGYTQAILPDSQLANLKGISGLPV